MEEKSTRPYSAGYGKEKNTMTYQELTEAIKNGRKSFTGEDLRNQSFYGLDLTDAEFSGADLRGAVFGDDNLTWARFDGADLRGAYFRNSDLKGAFFNGADLRGALFDESILHLTHFNGADLRGASSYCCDFSSSIFDGAFLLYTFESIFV